MKKTKVIKKKMSAKVKKSKATKPSKLTKSPVRKTHPKNRVTFKKSFGQKITDKVENIIADVLQKTMNKPTDLVTAILQDHEGLRQFIGILKDTSRDMIERRRAYESFSALLKSHTVSEENAVYKPIELNAKADLVIRIEEGFVEHRVADDVMARLEEATDPVIWSAHANVLAELVEHHLDEEEEKLFPLVREQIPKKMEADLILKYLELRSSTQEKVTSRNEGVLGSLQD